MNFIKRILTAPPSEPSAAARAARDTAPLDREETRPDVIAQLETLDDVIFAAIDGDPAALQESQDAWERAVAELGHETIEETRRQYLRHAQSVWENLRRQQVQPPHKIFAAIEVIGLLVNAERT
jgi:hypothetical protein